MSKLTTKDRRLDFSINIGSSSLLIIFVILCLVSFATLSISNAYADYNLSSKVLNRNTAYYNACNQAEINIAHIDRTLANVYETCLSEDEYYSTVGRYKSYAIPISDLQSLLVIIDINYPLALGESFYSIRTWQVITTGELNYSTSLPVIQ